MEIIENFVNKDFEDKVLKLIPKKINKTYNRNQIFRYGSKIPYVPFHKSDVIPDIFNFMDKIEFDSVTINEYRNGQSIDWHVDHLQCGPNIGIISLINDGELLFRKNKGEQSKSFLLPRFSLAIMSGELRYEWEHSFKSKNHRISVVFRNSKSQ